MKSYRVEKVEGHSTAESVDTVTRGEIGRAKGIGLINYKLLNCGGVVM